MTSDNLETILSPCTQVKIIYAFLVIMFGLDSNMVQHSTLQRFCLRPEREWKTRVANVDYCITINDI